MIPNIAFGISAPPPKFLTKRGIISAWSHRILFACTLTMRKEKMGRERDGTHRVSLDVSRAANVLARYTVASTWSHVELTVLVMDNRTLALATLPRACNISRLIYFLKTRFHTLTCREGDDFLKFSLREALWPFFYSTPWRCTDILFERCRFNLIANLILFIKILSVWINLNDIIR